MLARTLMILAAASLVLPAGCKKDSAPQADGKIKIVATIFPIADSVRQVGGNHVFVQCLVDSGTSPHDFQIKARHARMLAQSDMVVMVGMGLDQWAISSAAMARRQNANVLTLSKCVTPPKPSPSAAATQQSQPDADEHEDADEHDHGQHDAQHDHSHGNPHIWLSPVMMQQIVGAIADELSGIDPANKQDYAKNAQGYIAQLKQLDQDYRTSLAKVRQKNFVTFHEAFTYIADEYGLRQVALEPPSATEFNAGQLNRLRQFIQQNNIKVIFVEPQFPADKLRQLAQQTGAQLDKLDPEGGEGIKGYDSYLAMMRSNLQTMVKAME